MLNPYISQNNPTIILTPKQQTPNRRHSTHIYFTHQQSPNAIHTARPQYFNQGRPYMPISLGNCFNKSTAEPKYKVQTERSFDNSNRRYSMRMNSPKNSKVVSKNTLKPSHKPKPIKLSLQNKLFINTTLPTRPHLDALQPINNYPLQNNDLPQTLQMINQKLRQLKLSQSVDPIVHPYRDRSTDSYHYGHGYGHDKIVIPQQNYITRPSASEQPAQNNKIQQPVEPVTPNFNHHISNKMNIYSQYYPYLANQQKPRKKKQNQNGIKSIKQDIQQQKQSKQLIRIYEHQKQAYKNQHLKQIRQQQIYDSKKAQGYTAKQQQQIYQYQHKYQQQPIFTYHNKQQSQNNLYQSQAQKCEKLKYVYKPFSMNLSSNTQNKKQTTNSQDKNNITKPFLSKIDKIRNHKILHNTDKQVQYFQEEDKWDKILRQRQQIYNNAIQREQFDQAPPETANKIQPITAANTAIKHLQNNALQQLHHYSAASYQSSQINRQNGEGSQIQYSQLALSGPHIYGASFYSPSPEQDESPSNKRLLQKISQTNSNDNFYNKIHQLAQSNKQATVPDASSHKRKQILIPKEMKYSYNFEQNKQIQYQKEKQLFSKLLSANQVQWMLIFNQMMQHVQNKYFVGQNRYSRKQVPSIIQYNQPQQMRKQMFITFVKIGNDGQTVYQNRMIGHYIGVWLLSMGYGQNQVKERVVDNVDLMFMDMDEIIQKDRLQKQRLESQVMQNQQQENEQNQQCSIKQIAQIMYNNLLYGYLPADLQLRALLQVCKRGWEYMTFLICKILRLLIKIHKNNMKDSSRFIKVVCQSNNSFISQQLLYKKLQAIINNS